MEEFDELFGTDSPASKEAPATSNPSADFDDIFGDDPAPTAPAPAAADFSDIFGDADAATTSSGGAGADAPQLMAKDEQQSFLDWLGEVRPRGRSARAL